ncbi:phosphoadenosine phosphosulfate reductase family protein [Duganella vulcania]|uniref:Phosphoadenosine phosphosulfate reductase family protein n=1 Tax=Duganella vulcania TaxID=2692166 RepID=A0A845GJ14_9BURK|nr:phosphoadenosine phosphosulfate reductase family protein [Duganella vulcania]MYM92649.1 phosphoadenosine phosphosulfate reductase family protein [Duganella vulcania]
MRTLFSDEELIHCGLARPAPIRHPIAYEPHERPNLSDYDRFLVFFSGGKDSVACFLWLLDQGIPVDKIELHHHLVDGREGSKLMDWPITTDYCVKFAQAFGVRLSFSWKEGGFEREMLRENAPTAPVHFYTQSGEKRQIGGDGKLNTRKKFPQVSADLSVRWCSSYLKISVGESYIVNDPVFRQGKTLVLTGERAEESAARAKYKVFEPHRADNRNGARVKRWVDVYRAVHGWPEQQVWEIFRKFGVNPHPAYHLGLGRTSCMACIFGSPKQWAMLKHYMPTHFKSISDYETLFNTTIKRGASVVQTAAKGVVPELDRFWLEVAMGETFTPQILLNPATWSYPLGAFGESSGPT